MEERFDYFNALPEASGMMVELGNLVRSGNVEKELIHLINIRASILNGCAFCVDMHIKESKIAGIPIIKLAHLNVWRESPIFSVRERAALEWTDAVTRLSESGVSDEVYQHVREFFDAKELTTLTWALCVINSWNRMSVASRTLPGSMDKLLGLEKAGLFI